MIYSLKYTDENMKEGQGGYAKFWFIRIRPKYKDDKGILAHELEHVKQFWRRGIYFHSLRYLLSKDYRLDCEVEAYKEQLKYAPATTDPDTYRKMYAGFIAKGYNLKITTEEAENKLRR